MQKIMVNLDKISIPIILNLFIAEQKENTPFYIIVQEMFR